MRNKQFSLFSSSFSVDAKNELVTPTSIPFQCLSIEYIYLVNIKIRIDMSFQVSSVWNEHIFEIVFDECVFSRMSFYRLLLVRIKNVVIVMNIKYSATKWRHRQIFANNSTWDFRPAKTKIFNSCCFFKGFRLRLNGILICWCWLPFSIDIITKAHSVILWANDN